MDGHLDLGHGVRVPLDEVELRVSRSGGPGGQHANVTASRVEAVFDVVASEALGEADKQRIASRLGPRVTAVAQDTRSQARNRQLALERLRERLAGALVRRKARRATRPGAGARKRRAESKRRRSETKKLRRRPEA